MTVKARITVGVVDGHHVAVSFIVAGGSDGAGLCGIDCRAGAGGEVHAVVPLVCAAQRVDAVAVCVGDRNRVRERVQKASRGRRRTGIGTNL